MGKELNEYLQTVFSINDSAIFLAIVIALIIIVLYAYCAYSFISADVSFYNKDKKYKFRTSKLMALFTEFAPDPIIRINEEGTILYANGAAREILPNEELSGKNIRNYFSTLPVNLIELIKNNNLFHISFEINNKFYEVRFKYLSSLHFVHMYFKDLTERYLLENELIESQKQLRYLSNHLQNSAEEERKNIAVELHDSIGQNLLFIKLLLQNSNSGQKLKQIQPRILPALDSTIDRLKKLSYQLKPKILGEVDLPSAIMALSNDIMNEREIKGEVDFIGPKERFNNKIEISIYRIVQEALENIITHSKAKHFSIQIINNENSIRVVISDDGIGFESSPNPRFQFGLSHIKERTESLFGTLKIESSCGEGTIIMISIPKDHHETIEEKYQTLNS